MPRNSWIPFTTYLLLLLAGCSERAVTSSDGAPLDSSRDAAGPSGSRDAAGDRGGSDAPSTAVPPVDRARYLSDLEQIAKPRPPGSDHWQVVQDLCADRFEALGFTVTREDYGTGVNVIGTRLGSTRPAEQVLVSAHYDHLVGCAGADDNATGVAGLFETAHVLAAQSHARTLVVACWDEEERGLQGSRAYAAAAETRGDEIVMSYVYEMIGYSSAEPNTQELPPGFELLFPTQVSQLNADGRRGNFIAVAHDLHTSGAPTAAAEAFARTASAVDLPVVVLPVSTVLLRQLGALLRSDHTSFWLHGFASMMITDTANFRNPSYHCVSGPDEIADLNHDFAVKVIQSTVGSALLLLDTED